MVRIVPHQFGEPAKSLDKKPVKAHPEVNWMISMFHFFFYLVKELRKRHGIGLPGIYFISVSPCKLLYAPGDPMSIPR